MLVLEKCRVIVGRGSGACFSVLSGKRHQERTAHRTEKTAARLLVRDADLSIPLSCSLSSRKSTQNQPPARSRAPAPVQVARDPIRSTPSRHPDMPVNIALIFAI